MAQIINPQQTWQEALGSGLGSGIQTGVQALLEQKLQAMGQEQQANQRQKALEGLQKSGLLGENITPDALQGLKHVPETLLNTILKQKMQEPQNAAYARALQGILGGDEGSVGQLPAGLSAQQAGQLAELGIKKQKQIRESQKDIEPFLKEHGNDLKMSKELHKKATAMLENLEKNKAKFPKGLFGYKPDILQRDPDVRKYVADANTLVSLLAGSRKGTPTNFKIRLEQLSKPSLNQPIETQEALLRDIIGSAEDVFKTDETIRNIKKENKGLYPRDLVSQLVEQEGLPTTQKKTNPTPIKSGSLVSSVSADMRPVGQKAINTKTKEAFYWDGQDWITEKEWEQKNGSK